MDMFSIANLLKMADRGQIQTFAIACIDGVKKIYIDEKEVLPINIVIKSLDSKEDK